MTGEWRHQEQWNREERRLSLKLHLLGYSVNEISREGGDWYVRFGGRHAPLIVSSDTAAGIIANLKAQK